ncbi:endonuclease domain-containing protein [Roseiterribacter gracilis]|uniref:DUF559 domain-containing protein n=1 Tax=Roseiterribacter gracilis TaxID=2812848 RepID=A0A8S8XD53_9PROT|nr:hypothetical protein TMPK1_14440 [Rhodospirillales bacterium TMPK1]
MRPSERARALRRVATDVERSLWRRMRNRALAGCKFRRQLPIGPYFADFACVEAKLVVELDGSQHADAAAYDATRTAYMEAQGWRVLRFWNNEVMQNLDGVLVAIAAALNQEPSP